MKELTKRISQNTASFRAGTIGARILASVLLVVVVGAVLATPIAALADSEMVADGGFVDAGACRSQWKFDHAQFALRPWSEVGWKSNPCGDLIRGRTRCETFPVLTHYNTAPSGIIVNTGKNVWGKTNCKADDGGILRGEYQWRRPGAGKQWSAWKTFWHT